MPKCETCDAYRANADRPGWGTCHSRPPVMPTGVPEPEDKGHPIRIGTWPHVWGELEGCRRHSDNPHGQRL